MSLPLDQFIKNLIASGLMTADDVEEFQTELTPAHRTDGPRPLADGEARELATAGERGRLTIYDAGSLTPRHTIGLRPTPCSVASSAGDRFAPRPFASLRVTGLSF